MSLIENAKMNMNEMRNRKNHKTQKPETYKLYKNRNQQKHGRRNDNLYHEINIKM